MTEIERLEAVQRWFEAHRPDTPDWAREAVALRLEYAWEACVRITGYAPYLPTLVHGIAQRALEDLARGALERVI